MGTETDTPVRLTSRVLAWLVVVCLCSGSVLAHADGQIECRSDNYRYTYCRVDTGNVVQLTRQQSKTRCELGRSWGYDGRGIWVDDGCAAIFEYGYRGGGRDDHRHKDHTGEVIAGVAAVAILGAILSSDKSDHRQDRDGNDERVPGWAVGSFTGYDSRSGMEIDIAIDRRGRISGYAGHGDIDGQLDGDRAWLGNRRYSVENARDGFRFIADDDRRQVIDFRRDR